MLRQAYDSFIDNLILEYADREPDYFSLHAKNLPLNEQKLFLTYLVTVEDYEDFSANETRLKAAIDDYLGEMQFLIDERIDDFYHEYKRELSEGQYE